MGCPVASESPSHIKRQRTWSIATKPWSIDNSKFGGLKKQSEINWSASPIIMTLSQRFSVGNFGLFVGGTSDAKFTDNDWCNSMDGRRCSGNNPAEGGKNVFNYSSDRSLSASMYRVGAYYSGDIHVFENKTGFDSLRLTNKTSIYVDYYKSKGQ